MDEQNLNILERIHALYYHLTATERRVADYVLSNSAEVQFVSITQLADECGVADATISRFCKKLHLKGFNAFKIELARHAVSAEVHAGELPEADSQEGRCQQAGYDAQEAIRQTVELTDPKLILQTVELLEQADNVICLGSGGSTILAMEMAHLFSTVSGKFRAVFDSHLQTIATAALKPNDVIILFSYSGATTDGQQLLELANSKGIHSILVTRYHKSPAAKLADIVLRCGSNEGPFQSGSISARVAQLVLMDILFREYCHRNRKCCDKNIRLIASALSSKHV